MSYKVVPLDMISAPNFYSPIHGGVWTITSPNATTLWLQLQIVDSLGERRFISGAGAVLQATFQRADLFGQAGTQLTQFTQTPRSITKTAVAHVSDKSIFNIALTSQDVQGLTGQTVKFSYVDGAINEVWVQNWAVSKKTTDAGT